MDARQLKQNTKDIEEIKTTLTVMKDNHLAHIEKDMASMDKRIEKMDARMWWVLGLIVTSTLVAFIGDKI